MNNFDPKYIKISSKYLDEKMQSLGIKKAKKREVQEKQEFSFQTIIKSVFKS